MNMETLSLTTERVAPQGFASVKDDFPVFQDNPGLVFLDSAASSQKPAAVIDAVSDLYARNYANVHRGVYRLSERATALFEASRDTVQRFLNARSREEVVFTRGATESINLLAYSWADRLMPHGGEVVSTVIEHHANFVPWQQLAERRGNKIHYVGLTPEERFDREAFSKALSEKTSLVAITHIANGIGLKLPVEELIEEAHQAGALVVLDASQSVPHLPVDVQKLDADFLVFSGHKIYGPSGIGVLWGKRELLEEMPPFQFGGDMILSVSVKGTTFNEVPARFEAGTPNIAGAVGLSAALDYVSRFGMAEVAKHETQLVRQLEDALEQIPQVRMLAPKGEHHGLVCFDVPTVHPHDLAQGLDQENIAVRAGHHCAQPLLEYLGLQASTRASLGIYNTTEDIERFAAALEKVVNFFG